LLDIVLPKEASIDLVNLVFDPNAPDRKTALEAIQ
jgi:asparagine synthetase B (glutamine-hydrolysing)